MYLKTSEKNDYYDYERTDVLSDEEEKRFLEQYEHYPDEYFGVVSDFVHEIGIQSLSISLSMIRKSFCIHFKKAHKLYWEMCLHNRISLFYTTYRIVDRKKKEYQSDFIISKNNNYMSIQYRLGEAKFGFTTEDYMKRFPDCVFKNVLAFDEITIDNTRLVKDAEYLVKETFGCSTDYSPDHAKALIELGNCLITDSNFDTSANFLKEIYCKCDPRDVDLIGYKIYSEFPHILHLFDLKWLHRELSIRISLREGKDIYPYTRNRDIAQLMTHKTPIVVIVPEFNDLLNESGAKKELKDLLINCHQFGISFVFFSKYSAADLALSGIKRMLTITDEQHILSIFDKTEQIESDISIADTDEMSGIEFESFCMGVLQKNGFENVRMTETTGDYGGDLLAEKDEIKYVIQCKRYNSSIGISAIQEVVGSREVYHTHVGVVLTNSHFTKNAEILAEKTNVLLWDRSRLSRLFASGNNKDS